MTLTPTRSPKPQPQPLTPTLTDKVSDDAIVDLSGVKLMNGGCSAPSFTCADWAPLKAYPIFISTGTRSLVSMQGCVVEPNFGHGVQVASGHFYDNVIYKPSTGFRLLGYGTIVARYNAVFSVRGKPLIRTHYP